MNSNEIKSRQNSPERRKFVWGASVLSVMAIVGSIFKFPFLTSKNITESKPQSKKKMVRMLTQDGKLVEIDEALLTASRTKISDAELQGWIKK